MERYRRRENIEEEEKKSNGDPLCLYCALIPGCFKLTISRAHEWFWTHYGTVDA